MFGQQNTQQPENDVSFTLSGTLKIVLECNAPPFASHLSLIRDDNELIVVSVSADSSQVLKETMANSECTEHALLNLLHELQLIQFASEVQNELSTLKPGFSS